MEALAARGEEVGVGVRGGKGLRRGGVLDQIAVGELGENRFERAAKAVENADGILERRDAGAGDGFGGLRKERQPSAG